MGYFGEVFDEFTKGGEHAESALARALRRLAVGLESGGITIEGADLELGGMSAKITLDLSRDVEE